MANISVLYHHFPHYRAPVLKALARSQRNSYTFFGSLDDYQGIRAFQGDSEVKIHPIDFRANVLRRMDIFGFDRAVATPFDACIIIGHINMLGSWRAQAQAKRNGLATAYWAHGWLKKEAWLKSKLRNFYFSRADRVLTYGARARDIAGAAGFSVDRIRVIWNSLDWVAQSNLYLKWRETPSAVLRRDVGMPLDVPILLTISRVTDICRYDWLIMAAARIRAMNGPPVEVWMIGDGPAAAGLASLASDLKVPLHLRGAQYDEECIARQIMAADLVVSPGKVGLTAMHALAYGTPVITHRDFDQQMPEVEAIIEGESGGFFDFGDVDGLADAIVGVLAGVSDRSMVRERCRASLEGRFTPTDQARLIDDVMDEMLHDSK